MRTNLFSRILICLLLPFFIQIVLVSCKCDTEPVAFNFINKEINVLNLDNAGSEIKVSNSDSVAMKAYGMRLEIVRELVAKRNSINLFSNQAYAFTKWCPVAIYHTKSKIEQIKIFTVDDFDNEHPAESDIADLFIWEQYGAFREIDNSYYDDNDDIYRNKGDETLGNLILNFLLMKAPQEQGWYRFRLEVHLSDSSILSNTTSVNLIES